MATTSSQLARPAGRRGHIRARTVEEALDLSVEIMTERGVAGLTVSELARRMGMRGPSLYKYFGSLHDLYDALFARALAANVEAVRAAAAGAAPGVDWIRATTRAIVRWSVENPALAQLLYWRVVPGFEPSPETFAVSEGLMVEVRRAFADAVRSGQLGTAADSDDAVRLQTVIASGLITQQMANEPGAGFDEGGFSALTDTALDMFFSSYAPERSR